MALESYQAIYLVKVDGPGIIPGNILTKDRWSWNYVYENQTFDMFRVCFFGNSKFEI